MTEAELAAAQTALRDRAEALELRLTGMATPPERGSEIGFGKRVGDGTNSQSAAVSFG